MRLVEWHFGACAQHPEAEPQWAWQGLNVGLLEECITCGLGFWAYELGQSLFAQSRGRNPTPGERGCIGGCTAMTNMSVTLPLVLVQRRMQVRMLIPSRHRTAGWAGVSCARGVVS